MRSRSWPDRPSIRPEVSIHVRSAATSARHSQNSQTSWDENVQLQRETMALNLGFIDKTFNTNIVGRLPLLLTVLVCMIVGAPTVNHESSRVASSLVAESTSLRALAVIMYSLDDYLGSRHGLEKMMETTWIVYRTYYVHSSI